MPFGGEKITIVRAGDKLSDAFKVRKEIKEKVGGIVDYHTTPEFEMLFICGEGLYARYKQSGLEPKQFAEKNVVFHKKSYDCSNNWIEDYVGSNSNDEIMKMFVEYDKRRKAAHKDWHSISELVRK